MTRAGFCTDCGDNVYLTDEGGCPEGHGPECIRDAYEVADESAASETVGDDAAAADVAAGAEPVVSETDKTGDDFFAAGQVEVATAEGAPKKGPGLVVYVVGAVVLLAVLVGGAFLLVPSLTRDNTPKSTTGVAAADKAKVETAIAFLDALFSDDTMRIKPMLTDEAQNAITASQWDDIASAFPTITVTFDQPTWSSDTTAVVAVTTEDATATLEAGVSADSTNSVNISLDVDGTKEQAVVTLQPVKGGWRVLSIMDATGGATLYDDAFVKNLYEEATAQ